MSFQLHKYPYAYQAYIEQQNIATMLGDTMPEDFKDLLSRAIDIVESYVDGTLVDKENILLACILRVASPFTFDDIRRFETEYRPGTIDIVNAILNGDDDQPALLQAQMVFTIICLQDLSCNAPPVDATWQEVAQSLAELSQLLPSAPDQTSPRLKARVEEEIAVASNLVQMRIAQASAAPPANKPRGPSF